MTPTAKKVKLEIEANPTHSDRRIGAACGVSHVTVARVRRRYCSNQKKRTGRDGKLRHSPLAANADLLGELNDCLSRAESVLRRIKARLEMEKPRAMTFADIWKGKQPMLPSKTRPQLIKHLKDQAKRMDHAFGDAIYRH